MSKSSTKYQNDKHFFGCNFAPDFLYLREFLALWDLNSGIYAFCRANFITKMIFLIDCGSVYRHSAMQRNITRVNLMKLRNKLAASVVVLGLGSTMAVAEGLERVNLDTSFLYEIGTFAEVSMGNVNPSIPATWTGKTETGKAAGSSDNVAKSFSVSNFAAKTQIGDGVDIGVWSTNNAAGVALDWGSVVDVKADLTVSALAGLLRYSISENFSIIGGLKRYSSDSGASVTTAIHPTKTGIVTSTYTIGSGSTTVGVYGVAYERPDIAMRLEILSEGAGTLKVDADYSNIYSNGATPPVLTPTTGTGKAKIGLGDAVTVKFQTGIAPGTLLFGSLRHSKWADNQVVVPTKSSGLQTLSTFGDGQSYTIGLGRKFSDTLSGSISTFYDPASDCNNSSALSPTCENRSISLGAKVAIAENMNLSIGTTWSRRGTAKATTMAGTATTSKSVVSSIGAKLSYSF